MAYTGGRDELRNQPRLNHMLLNHVWLDPQTYENNIPLPKDVEYPDTDYSSQTSAASERPYRNEVMIPTDHSWNHIESLTSGMPIAFQNEYALALSEHSNPSVQSNYNLAEVERMINWHFLTAFIEKTGKQDDLPTFHDWTRTKEFLANIKFPGFEQDCVALPSIMKAGPAASLSSVSSQWSEQPVAQKSYSALLK